MNVSRGFMAIAVLYILVGMLFGMYMGGSGDHKLAPLHAHINLLGFVLPMVFGLYYHVIPANAGGAMARAQFWLYQAGVLVMMVMLYFVLSGGIAEDSAAMILMPITEIVVVIATAIFAWNVWKTAS